jgi:molybdopterin/thiamine biosynthesis adenylyltransferase
MKVDLRLFQQLFWYKNYSDDFVKYATLNKSCLALLQSIQFLNATNESNQTILEKYIIDVIPSTMTELIPYVQQKIKSSIYNRFYTILNEADNELLYSLVNTILYQMDHDNENATVPTSATAYKNIPFMEGDTVRFSGTIKTDIEGQLDFTYGIELELTTTITSPLYTTLPAEPTDTFIFLPMDNGVVSMANINTVVSIYVPVNLDYPTYIAALTANYTTVGTTFATSIVKAQDYHNLYEDTGNYIYEMYAIGICTNIALYYRGYTLHC